MCDHHPSTDKGRIVSLEGMHRRDIVRALWSGSMLLGVRAIDYRFRLNKKIALSLFAGAARYDLATPAYGIYTGAGVQWRDAFPKYDIGLEYRFADKIARDNLLPDDPPNEGSRNDAFYDASLLTLYVSRRW